MTARRTWKKRESNVADFFQGQRTPLSGGNSKITRSDVIHEDLFIESGYEMLNGVEAFWNGLNIERIVRYATKVKPFAHLPGVNINYYDD